MSKNVRTQLGKVIGKSLNGYHSRVKPTIDELKFKEEYQGRIIDCMVGEVDDNYIETPETDAPVVKLEHSKEGVVKIPSIKGKTVLVDADGNETDTPAEGCRLVSVGEEEDNKLIMLSRNKNLFELDWHMVKKNTAPTTNGYYGYRIKFKPNTYYYITCVNDLGIDLLSHGKYCYINTNYGSMIWVVNKSNGTNGNNSVKVKTSADGYINFRSSYYTDKWLDDLNKVKIQIEEVASTTQNASSYIQPKHHKTEILLDEPLKGLPNEVCDEIVGNKIIKRIGIVESVADFRKNGVFDGTNGSRFVMTLKSAKQIKNATVISNLIPFKITNSSWKEEGCYIATDEFSANDSINIRLNEDLSIEEFKNKYKDLIIYYELEEPIIEELPNSITLQGFDNTTMYIENSITPTVSYGYNALIPYKQELLKQQKEIENNTLDVENNIIPYLMDMEFNLMLMKENK